MTTSPILRTACWLAVGLLLAGCQGRQPQPAADQRPVPDHLVSGPMHANEAVVRMQLRLSNSLVSLMFPYEGHGIAVCVEDGRYMTVAHMFDTDQLSGRVIQTLRLEPLIGSTSRPPFERVTGVHADRARDLAVFQALPAQIAPRAFRLANQSPEIGQTVYHTLASQNRPNSEIRTRSAQVVAISTDGHYFAIAGQSRPGDSGSPITDEQGRLLGLVSGSPDPSRADTDWIWHFLAMEAIPEHFVVERGLEAGYFHVRGSKRRLFSRIHHGPYVLCSAVTVPLAQQD